MLYKPREIQKFWRLPLFALSAMQ